MNYILNCFILLCTIFGMAAAITDNFVVCAVYYGFPAGYAAYTAFNNIVNDYMREL